MTQAVITCYKNKATMLRDDTNTIYTGKTIDEFTNHFLGLTLKHIIIIYDKRPDTLIETILKPCITSAHGTLKETTI